jgi:hypothetical protein
MPIIPAGWEAQVRGLKSKAGLSKKFENAPEK